MNKTQFIMQIDGLVGAKEVLRTVPEKTAFLLVLHPKDRLRLLGMVSHTYHACILPLVILLQLLHRAEASCLIEHAALVVLRKCLHYAEAQTGSSLLLQAFLIVLNWQ